MELQMRIILLFIVMISSAAETVKKNLTGTEEGSITLPDPVVELGFLSFGVKIIAMVDDKKVRIVEEIYKDRLLWNTSTGLFTITGLQRNDSGIYKIDSKKGNIVTASYKLTVYDSVPTPTVDTLSVTADSCTLLCLVETAEETTLLWYKDEEIVNQSSSALSLPLAVHKKDFSSSYRCVATNPVEEKTVKVNILLSCGQNSTDTESKRHYMMTIPIVFAVIVIVLVACIIKMKYLDKKTSTTRHAQVNTGPDVEYTDILITEDRGNQGGNISDSSGSVDRSNLTTVYDKLEAHRMVDINTDTHVYEQTNTMDYPQT